MRAPRTAMLLAATAIAATACSGSVSTGDLDQDEIEADLDQEDVQADLDQEEVEADLVGVLEEGLPGSDGTTTADFSPWEADCSGMPTTVEPGFSFSCTATAEELSLPITVSEDDEGAVTYTVE
jgi:hypothetical protein